MAGKVGWQGQPQDRSLRGFLLDSSVAHSSQPLVTGPTMKVHGDKLMYVMSFNEKLSTILVLQLVYKMVPLAAEVVEGLVSER